MEKRDMRGGNYSAEVEAASVYQQRREALAEKIGGGTVVFWGNGDDRGAGDVGTFGQNSDFYYLSGVELPNAVLVLRPEDKEEFLFLPARDPDVERWTGPKFGPGEEAEKALGFQHVVSMSPSQMTLDARIRPLPGFEGRLQSWLSEEKAVLHTLYAALSPAEELDSTHRLVARLRERLSSFEVQDCTQEISALRFRKSVGEIALMRRAVDATIQGHHAASLSLRPGVPEGLLDGVIYQAFRASGAEGLAFPSIVGSGVNATTLHYDQNVDVCADGELVVVDIGARYGYYCGDLTRTYPVNGKFSERQRKLYSLVLEAHDRVAEAMRPGRTLFELRKIAFGVFEDSPLRDSKGERLSQYFIHGLGHHLGLDAHDPGGDYLVLEPGMVITNEPGLYIPNEGIGIRIEDDHVLTADGNENLSAALPTAPDEIEKMMAG